MRIIITEEQFNRFNKSSAALQKGIIKYLNLLISNGKRKVRTKNNNYGNLSEEWCIDGLSSITAIYYFEDGKFSSGHLFISNDIVNNIRNVFSVKKSYALHVNESGLSIDDISSVEKTKPCKDEPVRPEGITDNEMIDYIVAHTLFKRQDVIRQLENGRDLDVFYFDVKDRENN